LREFGYYCNLEEPNFCYEICGDGKKVNVKEECDDGNDLDNDGCSSTCLIEHGYYCSGIEPSLCESDCFDNL